MDPTDVTDAECERHISPTTEAAQAIQRLAHSIAHLRPLGSDELRDATEHPYIVTGNLARWLVENRDTLADADLKPLFDEVEQQLVGGSKPVRELLAEGLLEDLQNLASARSMPEEAWVPHLGPRTLQTWRLMQDLWGAG